jgi:hypothetical protein
METIGDGGPAKRPLARSIHMQRFSRMRLDPSWIQLWRLVHIVKIDVAESSRKNPAHKRVVASSLVVT